MENRDASKARVRVRLNGLQRLEMRRDILLPSGDVKEVELEYEQLEKHCFLCKALTHEDTHCPSTVETEPRALSNRPVDITQRNTINRLEERKRSYNERQQAKGSRPSAQHRLQWSNSKDHRSELHWVPKAGYSDNTPRGSLRSEYRSREASPIHRNYRHSDSRGSDHRYHRITSRRSPPRVTDVSHSNRLSARLSGSRRSYNRESPLEEATSKSYPPQGNPLLRSGYRE